MLRHIKLTSTGGNGPLGAFLANKNLHNRSLRTSAAWYSMKGGRDQQEDRVTVIPDLAELPGCDDPRYSGYAYMGIFDGHGGARQRCDPSSSAAPQLLLLRSAAVPAPLPARTGSLRMKKGNYANLNMTDAAVQAASHAPAGL